MSKTIALDLGGVCVRLHYEEFLQGWGVPALPEALRPLFRDFECGRACAAELYAGCCRALPGVLAAGEDVFWQRFRAIIGGDMPGMPELVRRWRSAGFRLILFSNTSPVHADEVWRKFSFGACIDGAVYSYDAGAMKPDAAIYHYFAERHGPPDYYFDDSAENIAAGRQMGWNSLLFSGAAEWLARSAW